MLVKLLATAVATLCGIGRIRVRGPGTLGSLATLPIWWALLAYPIEHQIIFIFCAFVVGWLATHFYEKWSRRHDPKEVVVDELIGMCITLLGAPQKFSVFLVGFFLFRLLDIRKPWLIGYIDRKVPGALGTILDDILAGITALIVLQILLHLGSPFGIFDY